MLYSVIWLLTRVPKNDWKNSTEAENSSNNHTETVKKCKQIMLIIFCFRVTVNAGYYGLTLNSGKIGGNIFVNFTISATMELLAYILCLVFLDRIGRRAVHCFCIDWFPDLVVLYLNNSQ
jgi:hypothetical protein